MAFLADLKILYHMLFKPVRGDSHAQRMESFYGGQAAAYDDFRKRLLKGRAELYQSLPALPEGIWIDMGGGTGSNIEYLAPRIAQLQKIYVVDLSASLLKVAQQRFSRMGWDNVETAEADATQFSPPEKVADVVTFSYSLTMIPDWFAAIENAFRILKPGGHIGVVDFYVGRKFPATGTRQHRWLARNLWQPWFAIDNVFPSSDHLPFLRHHFEQIELVEDRHKLPYVPLLRTPIYRFIGRKRESC